MPLLQWQPLFVRPALWDLKGWTTSLLLGAGGGARGLHLLPHLALVSFSSRSEDLATFEYGRHAVRWPKK